MLERSELLPLGTLVAPGGLSPLNVPRASVTVFMALSSPRVLLSIFSAASELEKRAGRWGLMRRELEKKSGEGGWPEFLRLADLGKLKWSSVCLERVGSRRRLCRGSLSGWGGVSSCASVSVGRVERFLPAIAGGVLMAAAPRQTPPPPVTAAEAARRWDLCCSADGGGIHMRWAECDALSGFSTGVRGLNASGGCCKDSRYSGVLNRRASSWLGSAGVALDPVKMEVGGLLDGGFIDGKTSTGRRLLPRSGPGRQDVVGA